LCSCTVYPRAVIAVYFRAIIRTAVRKKVQANNGNKLSVQTASDCSKSQKCEAAERHDSYVSNHFTRKWLWDKGDSPESRHTLKGTVSERIPFRWEMRIRNEQGLLTQVKGEKREAC
jgi:hypothetical protein